MTYTVNNIGNPILWWLSSATMLLIFLTHIQIETRSFLHRKNVSSGCGQGLDGTIHLKDRLKENSIRPTQSQTHSDRNHGLTLFVLIGYGANWLPWLWVKRCTFIYLYMPSAVFAFMGLAWLMSGWLQANSRCIRTMGWAMVVTIVLGFWFWLPLSIGSPLSTEGLQLRWLLKSWI